MAIKFFFSRMIAIYSIDVTYDYLINIRFNNYQSYS